MNIGEAFSQIEDPKTAATFTVASNLRTFVRAAKQNEAVEFLARQKPAAEWGRMLSDRIAAITTAPIDKSLRHPNDVPLAIYLWILGSVNEAAARAVGLELAKRLEGTLWWAAKMIDVMQSPAKDLASIIAPQPDSPFYAAKGTAEI